MRCRITPILRAKATFARFEPRRLAIRQQNIGSFIECRAHHLIPVSRDSAGDIFFTRLILPRCQPEQRSYRLRLRDPARVVHRRLEGNCHQRTNARHCHQPAADHVFTNTQAQPCAVSRTAPSKLPAPEASPQQCAPMWYDLSPIPESALQTFCGSPGRPSGRNRAGCPECSIPHPATFREAACARLAALGSPAIQSIWRAPDGTIPSAAAVQVHTHPCGPSSRSSPTMLPSHAASPAERFQIPLASARHAAIVITAPLQTQPDPLQSQVPSRNKQGPPARSRPSPPSRSCPAHPQRKRSTVPKRRRFLHSVPRLSSISDAWGRLNVVTPFHHLSGDSHLHRSLGAGPITASSQPA